ncbi:MAG: GntR family transcriptional regulator [Chloroflexi bacterium]|nr:GntR family transcriptional regulator [Chloroflexota bacterium]
MSNSTIHPLLLLDPRSPVPFHLQLEQQIRQAIAAGRLAPGARLPTVRALAGEQGVHVNTAAKVYAKLVAEGVLTTRPGRGTFVAEPAGKDRASLESDARLSGIAGRALVEALSLGYTPEQVEAAVTLRAARWRQEISAPATSGVVKEGRPGDTLIIMGSHDLTLDLLAAQLHLRSSLRMTSMHVGSLGGLIALARGEAHIAGCHLLDEETGEYNIPYVRRVLPGEHLFLVNLAHRVQGLMVPRGNPKGIGGLPDLARKDVTFINRQRGSGTRVLLDYSLRREGIDAAAVAGYVREETTHLAVAAAVAGGSADAGLGILAAARALDLDFLPFWRERYDLVMPAAFYEAAAGQAIVDVLRSEGFQRVVFELGGYDTVETGSVIAELRP